MFVSRHNYYRIMDSFVIMIAVITLMLFHCEVEGIGFGSAKRVLIIGVDGLGGKYLAQASNTPTFKRLQNDGSWTLKARGSVPTVSLPNWSGMFTGLEPEESGVYDNSWTDPSRGLTTCQSFGNVEDVCMNCAVCKSLAPNMQTYVQAGRSKATIITLASAGCNMLPNLASREQCTLFTERARKGEYDDLIDRTIAFLEDKSNPPEAVCAAPFLQVCKNSIPSVEGASKPRTLFRVVKEAIPTLTTAFYTDWEGVRYILEESAIDYWHVDTNYTTLTSSFIQLINSKKPDIMFIHLDSCDHAGESGGFGGDRYFDAISFVDGRIKLILDALTSADIVDETLVLITSDHGGFAKKHEYFPPKMESIQIPFFAYGPSVKSNHEIQMYTRNMDLASTALYALGIKQPAHWVSRPLIEIYDDKPQIRLPEQSIDNVILIGIGGLRSSGLAKAIAPNIQLLIQNEHVANTMTCRATTPLLNLPNWQSIISGAGPEEHGVTTDEWPSTSLPPSSGEGEFFPSIFHILKEADSSIKVGAFYNQPALSRLLDNFLLDTNYQSPSTSDILLKGFEFIDKNINSKSSKSSSKSSKSLLFFELDEPNQAGIQYGYFSQEYYDAIQVVDGYVGTIVNYLKEKKNVMENTLIFIVGNQGGINPNECVGSDCLFVPFIVHGNALNNNSQLGDSMRVVDIAPSIALSMGFGSPDYWTGRGIAFVPIKDGVNKNNSNRETKIIVAIVVPLIIVAVAVIVVVLILIYKKKKNAQQNSDYTKLDIAPSVSGGVELESIAE